MITLAIATRRQAEYQSILLTALQEEARQNLLPEGFELIVCENDIEPTLPEIFRKEKLLFDAEYLFRNDVRRSINLSRSKMLKLSRNDVVLFLDGDMIPPSGLIKGHLNAHEQFKGPIVTGWRKWVHPESDKLALNQPKYAVQQLSRFKQSKDIVSAEREKKEYSFLLNNKAPWGRGLGAHVSLKKSMGIRWDPSLLTWGLEDTDLFFSAIEKYYPSNPIAFKKELVAWHLDCDATSFNFFRQPGPSAEAKEFALQAAQVYKKHKKLGQLVWDAMYGFDRLEYNPSKDQWVVLSRNKRDSSKRKERLDYALAQL